MGVFPETLFRLVRGNRSGFQAVACTAGPSIATEGLAGEQGPAILALKNVVSLTLKVRHPKDEGE